MPVHTSVLDRISMDFDMLAVLVAFELKTEGKTLTGKQYVIMQEIKRGNGLYYICRSIEEINNIYKKFGYDRIEF